MPRTVRFHAICGAKLHGRPGQTCRRSVKVEGGKCPKHGGKSTGPRTAAGKARLAAIRAAGNRLRAAARQLRIARGGDPAIGRPGPKPKGAKVIPSSSGGASMQPPRAHDERPPWPADGYRGGNDARRLEAREREFIRELDAPLDLETLLLLRTGKPLSALSSAAVALALTAFVSTERQRVDHWLDWFAKAEAAWRRPDDGAAIRMRLARLHWEADAYIARLETEKVLLGMRLEEREREWRARTMAVSEQVVNAGQIAGSRLAGVPHEVDIWGNSVQPKPHNIAPRLRRS